MKHNRIIACAVFAACSAAATQARSQTEIETEERATPANNAQVSGILIGTYQTTSEDRVDGQSLNDEGNGQLYLFGSMDMGPGTWNLEVRGGTTPHDNGITRFYGEVNDSVGETVNSNGKGRIAATQLYYELGIGPGNLIVGMIDATGLLDANEIADDEYSQFIGTSFVNNPSIEYPSFALGANYNTAINDNLGFQIFVSSSGGLEDDDDHSYSNVFDVGESGKGAFTAGELTWSAGDNLYGDVGVWHNSRDHTELANDNRTDKDNYGAYTTIGGNVGSGQWVAWGGIANDKVSEAANFLALAYSHPLGDMTLGAGISRIGASDDLPEPASSIKQAELYLRIPVAGNFYVTPDLQYVDNSGFDPNLDNVFVAGVRAGLEF